MGLNVEEARQFSLLPSAGERKKKKGNWHKVKKNKQEIQSEHKKTLESGKALETCCTFKLRICHLRVTESPVGSWATCFQ